MMQQRSDSRICHVYVKCIKCVSELKFTITFDTNDLVLTSDIVPIIQPMESINT